MHTLKGTKSDQDSRQETELEKKCKICTAHFNDNVGHGGGPRQGVC